MVIKRLIFTKNKMDRIFHFSESKTDIHTEIIAGITTFLAMAYIIVVNPAVISQTGMSFNGVLFATILVSAFSSIAMGFYANLPYALAPGMGINAFFTYTLVMIMKIPWQTALGAVFISGIVFILLSIFKIRIIIVEAIPKSIRNAVACGIGIFIALIGFRNIHFIVSNPETLISFGGIDLNIILFIVGLFITSILVIKKVKGALILSIISISIITLIVSIVGTSLGFLSNPLVKPPAGIFALPSFDVFLKLDIIGALKWSMVFPIFSLLFVDLFDSIATFTGVAQVSNLIDKKGIPLNVGRALLIDATSTTISGLFGTSSGTVYIESAAGIKEGGRTGLTAIVAGFLFLPFMFLSPLISFIPPVATAPVLVIVGVFMMKPVIEIDWGNMEEAIPAFTSLILVPLTYSITQGVIWGFLTYTVIKLLMRKAKEIHWMLYVIDIFSIAALIRSFTS